MKTPSRYKVCRRVGDGVFVQCQTQKFHLRSSRKGGVRAKGFRRPRTDYGNQLIEKQKVRYSYNISERQLSNYVKKADSASGHAPGKLLYTYLESRLDNIIFRAGLAASRQQARQMVSHGHIYINGKKLNIPSYQVVPGAVITVKPKSKESALFREAEERQKTLQVPSWISRGENGAVTVLSLPVHGDLKEGYELDFSTVIEFYNRV